jgi:catechol 2,3-dioxygenase-like lactoylglutathione lyase family enzyme
MRVDRIGHVNIRTPLLEDTLVFYETYLGLHRGPATSAVMRADNVWLYDPHGLPLIHVNGPLPGEDLAPAGLTSRLDHVAFDCHGLAACRDRLEGDEIPFREMRLMGRGLRQINLLDPNGIKVELTFREDEEDL